jgi:hypothetical protein
MKLSQKQLRSIIEEELQTILEFAGGSEFELEPEAQQAAEEAIQKLLDNPQYLKNAKAFLAGQEESLEEINKRFNPRNDPNPWGSGLDLKSDPITKPPPKFDLSVGQTEVMLLANFVSLGIFDMIVGNDPKYTIGAGLTFAAGSLLYRFMKYVVEQAEYRKSIHYVPPPPRTGTYQRVEK